MLFSVPSPAMADRSSQHSIPLMLPNRQHPTSLLDYEKVLCRQVLLPADSYFLVNSWFLKILSNLFLRFHPPYISQGSIEGSPQSRYPRDPSPIHNDYLIHSK